MPFLPLSWIHFQPFSLFILLLFFAPNPRNGATGFSIDMEGTSCCSHVDVWADLLLIKKGNIFTPILCIFLVTVTSRSAVIVARSVRPYATDIPEM
jgi:hypothetical protein